MKVNEGQVKLDHLCEFAMMNVRRKHKISASKPYDYLV